MGSSRVTPPRWGATSEQWNGASSGDSTIHPPPDNSSAETNNEDWIDSFVYDFTANLNTHRQPTTIVLICFYVPVLVLAFVGNVLVLLVVLGNKAMRNATNYFLVNLAVSDLLVTVCLPLTIGDLVYRFWIFGEVLCKAVGYLQGVSVAASVLTIAALSVERFFAVRHPVSSRRLFTTTRVKASLAVIWATASTVMLPLAVVRTLELHDLSDGVTIAFCHERWYTSPHLRLPYDLFIFTVIYIVPGSIVVGSYALIGRRLVARDESLQRQYSSRHHRAGRGGESGGGGGGTRDRIMKGRRRLAQMLIVVAVLFAVSWLPYHAVSLYLDFVYENDAGTQMTLAMLSFFLLLGHSHSAQNPVIICVMSGPFKRGMADILRCRRHGVTADNHQQSEHSNVPIDLRQLVERRTSTILLTRCTQGHGQGQGQGQVKAKPT